MLGPEKGFIFYLIKWPLSAPSDAYRAGLNHHLAVAVFAFFLPGIPLIPARFFVGAFLASVNWYKAMRFG